VAKKVQQNETVPFSSLPSPLKSLQKAQISLNHQPIMPSEVQITSNRLVTVTPVLTGLLLVAPTRLATAPRATAEAFDEGGWPAKKVFCAKQTQSQNRI
jgi:hypothetical protein